MKRLLVTGGTVFVSKFIATYFSSKDYEVYVLNRGTRPQIPNVKLIRSDRHALSTILNDTFFDVIIDVCAYTLSDIQSLLDSGVSFNHYFFISSSAVYPETNTQPFVENQILGPNKIWGKYGTDKLAAEKYLLSRVPHAYILRPPYLYGPMQNVYREPFVFECAQKGRPFYIPKDGKMKLQFFHVEDLCKMIETLFHLTPDEHIYNVGNPEPISINTFVELCYQIVNAPLEKRYVLQHPNQRDYFSFHDYEYLLDVTKQNQLLGPTKDLYKGLRESYNWYTAHPNEVIKKPYIDFIINNFES